MKKALWLLPTVILLMGLAIVGACGDNDSSGSDGPTDTAAAATATDEPTATPVKTSDVTPRPITGTECGPGPQTGIGLIAYLEFDEETSQYDPGQDIAMKLVIRNCHSDTVELFYESEARYDFFVEDSGGQEVWRWTDEQDLGDESGELTIVAEETIEYSVTWDQRDSGGDEVDSGIYKVSAFSLGCGIENESGCHFGPVELLEIRE